VSTQPFRSHVARDDRIEVAQIRVIPDGEQSEIDTGNLSGSQKDSWEMDDWPFTDTITPGVRHTSECANSIRTVKSRGKEELQPQFHIAGGYSQFASQMWSVGSLFELIRSSTIDSKNGICEPSPLDKSIDQRRLDFQFHGHRFTDFTFSEHCGIEITISKCAFPEPGLTN
jgi:hypothetical protein